MFLVAISHYVGIHGNRKNSSRELFLDSKKECARFDAITIYNANIFHIIYNDSDKFKTNDCYEIIEV